MSALGATRRRRAGPSVLDERELEACEFGYRERVTDTALPHIRELPQRAARTLFAEAAARAEQAGFDGVELHYAHAYTMASFLSRAEHARRRLRRAARAPRAAAARGLSRGARARSASDSSSAAAFSPTSAWRAAAASRTRPGSARELARAGHGLPLALHGRQVRGREAAAGRRGRLSLHRAQRLRVHADRACRTSAGPFGRNVPPTRRGPRGGARRRPADAGGAVGRHLDLRAGRGAARARRGGHRRAPRARALADPDWFRKLRLGLGDEVRRCVFTNYCEGLDQKHKPVTCKLWDHLDVEGDETPRTADGRRRLVAPAWEPAARESRDRGRGTRRPLPGDPAQARRPGSPGHRRTSGIGPRTRSASASCSPTRPWRTSARPIPRSIRRWPRPRRAGTTSRSTTAAR